MKIDYKFEYRGKWYNILRLEHEDFGVYFEAKAITELCRNKKFNFTAEMAGFGIRERSLKKLIGELKAHNFNVYLLVQKLKWYAQNNGDFYSQPVVRKNRLGRYFLGGYNTTATYKYVVCEFIPLGNFRNVSIGTANDFRDAKWICKTDFEENGMHE